MKIALSLFWNDINKLWFFLRCIYETLDYTMKAGEDHFWIPFWIFENELFVYRKDWSEIWHKVIMAYLKILMQLKRCGAGFPDKNLGHSMITCVCVCVCVWVCVCVCVSVS